MRSNRLSGTLAWASAIAVVLLTTGFPDAYSGHLRAAEDIREQVMSGGGTRSTSSGYVLTGTVSQTAVGNVHSDERAINQGFWQAFYYSCCIGRVGDANGSGDDAPTIGDISIMIDAKFISETCGGKVTCLAEADVNQSAISEATCDDITIGDISMLIDYLFITGPENWDQGYGVGMLAPCP
jgi:hypothetical protein